MERDNLSSSSEGTRAEAVTGLSRYIHPPLRCARPRLRLVLVITIAAVTKACTQRLFLLGDSVSPTAHTGSLYYRQQRRRALCKMPQMQNLYASAEHRTRSLQDPQSPDSECRFSKVCSIPTAPSCSFHGNLPRHPSNQPKTASASSLSSRSSPVHQPRNALLER